jgi:signal transduction histidine kinase
LHDGLGSHLVGTMHMAQRPGVTGSVIAGQLADAVDQLKMTIDAMHETDGDIASLLGAARYRLDARLQSAGIELSWDVGSLPPVANWGPRQSYQLQMIIFEIFSNMIQHSASRKARLTARLSAGSAARRIEIEIMDDGRGFDVARAIAAPGKGLANIRSRAAELQADLAIDSRPGSTRFFISMALESGSGRA